MKKKYPVCLALAGCMALIATQPAGAREYSLFGSVGVYESYDSNARRQKDNRESQLTSTIAPSLTLRSTDQFDQLSITYAPGYTYNDLTEEGNIDHQLSLSARKEFAQHFNGTLSNSLMQGDSSTDRYGNIPVAPSRSYSTYTPPPVPGAQGEPGTMPAAPAFPPLGAPETSAVILSENRGSGRYWSNSFHISTSYEYWKDSFIDFSYANSILKNDTENATDYMRHNPGLMVRHRFSHEWSTDLSLDYDKGDFSQGEDLTTTSPGARINYHYSPHTSIFGDYQFSRAEYSGARPGYETHTPSVGYSGSLDQFTSLSVSLGSSLTTRDSGGDNSGLSYSLSLNRRLQHGALSLTGSGGQAAQNYNGLTTAAGTTEGLSQYWSLSGNFTHQLWKDLTGGLNVGLRGDDLIEQASSSSKKTAYNAGASLSYSFLRYYALTLRYSYRQVDGDLSSDDYAAHQAYMGLSASNELFRW